MRQTANSLEIRKITLDQSYRTHVWHIGSALSIADILDALYSSILEIVSPYDSDRDPFILSKGHAALALRASLQGRGWASAEELDTFCSDATYLGVHPEHRVRGIDFSTGSLGQGLSYGVGAALAARTRKSSRRVFVLISDGECNEGTIWVAIMFAAHHQLANLIALVDLNGQQALGYTQDVLNLSPLADRWRAFGWDVHDVDGHDAAELAMAIADLEPTSGPPHVLIAHTTFGKGVSCMENQVEWHYWSPSAAEYQQALLEIDAAL